MNFKKRVNGSWTDTPHYIHNTSTDTITTLPAVIYPTGTTATVGLKGNTTQSGTPTPDSPIMPQGTGERTGNLWDGTYKNNWGVNVASKRVYIATDRYAIIIPVDSNTDYTMSRSEVGASTYFIYGLSTGLPNDNTVFEYCDRFGSDALSQTVNSRECNYLTVFFGAALSPDITVNTGSTALPFEPFGVKIPISSAGQTTPVYLGEVQSTRRIKKLVLTGQEDVLTLGSSNIFGISNQEPPFKSYQYQLCSHYSSQSSWSDIQANNFSFGISSPQNTLVVHDNRYNSTTDFKNYLQQQYAAGTPVCAWYVLATPQTAVVNEPLMRIGDYADTLSNVSIPVIAGGDTISVGTTVQPSEVTVNYKGWHPVADVHEKSKNLFDKDRTNGIVDNSYINISGGTSTDSSYYISYPIYLTVGETYTWRFDNVLVHSAPTIGFYDNSNNLMGVAPHDTIVTNFSFTVPSGCAYVKCSVYKILRSEAMLNSGSTALPYEPYWT